MGLGINGVDEMKEVYPGPETVDRLVKKYSFDVACSQEEEIKQHLINLGWTPPEIDRGKNALLEDMSDDIDNLVKDNELLRSHIESLESELERYEDIVNQNNRSISLLYKQISEERRGIYET